VPKPTVRLVRVHAPELPTLKEYVEALYRYDEDYDSMVFIEEGLKSLFRNEALATAYFINSGEERVGYVILTRYHSVEKGGLMIYIDELYVEERYRRGGIGKGIMQEILKIAKAEGAKALWAQEIRWVPVEKLDDFAFPSANAKIVRWLKEKVDGERLRPAIQ